MRKTLLFLLLLAGAGIFLSKRAADTQISGTNDASGYMSAPTVSTDSELPKPFKSKPLKVAVNVHNGQWDIAIKNVSPETLILSKRALDEMDVLWFIEINGKTVTSGVRGELMIDGPSEDTISSETLFKDIEGRAQWIVMKTGETILFPIPKKSFIDSGIEKVASSISKESPLDLTVSLSNLIAGFLEQGDNLRPINGRILIFSTPIKVNQLTSLGPILNQH